MRTKLTAIEADLLNCMTNQGLPFDFVKHLKPLSARAFFGLRVKGLITPYFVALTWRVVERKQL